MDMNLDMNLIKTFLEVYRTRHFGRAAENLFLTQSAVSARIRLLEEGLGVVLFERKRKDMHLTPAGRRFLKHAEPLLRSWNRACRETAHVEHAEEFLAGGVVPVLWDALPADWLARLNQRKPSLSLSMEADSGESLVRRVLVGELDLALLLDPPPVEQLAVREVGRLSLLLVATRPSLTCGEVLGKGYAMVDWGGSFNALHELHFPDAPPSALKLGMSRPALEYVLTCDGAVYLPEFLVADPIRTKRLFPVVDAPVIEQRIVALFPRASRDAPLIEQLLDLLVA